MSWFVTKFIHHHYKEIIVLKSFVAEKFKILKTFFLGYFLLFLNIAIFSLIIALLSVNQIVIKRIFTKQINLFGIL